MATDITVPDDAWKPGSDDGSILHASITVNGCDMHLEAHAVTWRAPLGASDVQEQDGNSDFDAMASVFDIDGPHQEVTINGRQYVLFACAYGS